MSYVNHRGPYVAPLGYKYQGLYSDKKNYHTTVVEKASWRCQNNYYTTVIKTASMQM
jgi:hypothetical protein